MVLSTHRQINWTCAHVCGSYARVATREPTLADENLFVRMPANASQRNGAANVMSVTFAIFGRVAPFGVSVHGPHGIRTLPGQAPFGHVRGLYGAVPAPFLLLPGVMWVGRAASVFPTSPPQQAKRARSGTLQLCSVSEKAAGGKVVQAPGAARPRAAPAAGCKVPPDPAPDLPKTTTDPRRTDHRGRCPAPAARTAQRLPNAETCKRTGGTRDPPKPGPRFPRTPSRPPQPRGALRTPGPTRIPRRPRHRRKPAHRPADTPVLRRFRPTRNKST